MLVVEIEIEDNLEIEKIILNTATGADSILKDDINKNQKLQLETSLVGEGTYSIRIMMSNDTINLPEKYAEGGYRPKLKLKNDKIEVVRWF